MILITLIALPFFGGLCSYFLSLKSGETSRAFCTLVLALNLALAILAWPLGEADGTNGTWMLEVSYPWIPSLGAYFHLGLDGLSYVLVLLALSISFFAIVNLSEVPKRHEGLFSFLVMTTVSGVVGVFLAVDLLMFFLFWEVMLVPLYFLILLFGEDQRQKAATRFLILTQASGLFLLLSIVILYVAAGQSSFAFSDLIGLELSLETQMLVATGFFLAFLVKLPALPFHFWMPSIFASAPLSALMAGILIKTSAYGFIRFSKFSFPLFPNATDFFAPYLMVLGIVGLIFGAIVAYSQNDIKKILAYSTISHVGLMLAGLFSQTLVAMNGVTILIITQAISTGGLLMICNHVQASTRSRDLSRFSGLFKSMPNAGVFSLIFVMASIGLPGLGNFVGEWLVLLGLFQVDPWLGAIACLGVVLSALYMLRFMHAIFFGKVKDATSYRDISAKGIFLHTLLVIALVVIGIYPSIVIDTVYQTFEAAINGAIDNQGDAMLNTSKMGRNS